MKINKLLLRGAKGIKKGLGLDEIEIDFSQFKPGIVAFIGKNGSGKTTIMENLHPYRCLVSRDGSLHTHFFLKDSYRVLEFDYKGKSYESRILIDALTGSSEAYLKCNGVALNDGKLTTYDSEIEKILGTQQLFFSSFFSGQQAKGIAQLKPTERKKLFFELLNLDVYEGYLKSAKEKLNSAELELADVEGQIKALNVDPNDLENLKVELNSHKSNSAGYKMKVEELENRILSTEYQIKTTEYELLQLEESAKKNKELLEKISNIRSKHADEIQKLIEKRDSIEQELWKLNRETKGMEENIKNRPLIEEKLKSIADIECKLKKHKERKEQLRKELDVLQEKENEYQTLYSSKKEEYMKANSKVKEYEIIIKNLKEQQSALILNTKILDNVPCDVLIGQKCRFVSNAYSDKEKLNPLAEKISEYESQISLLNQSTFQMSKQLNELIDNHNTNELNALKELLKLEGQEISSLDSELFQLALDDWESQLKRIDTFQIKIESNCEKIEMLEKSFEDLVETIETANKNIAIQISEIEKEIVTTVNDLRDEKNGLLKTYSSELIELKNELAHNKDKVLNYEKSITVTAEKITVLNENIKKTTTLNQKRDKIQKEIIDWNFICKAFDKNGIPVLKLENSAVEITTITNELLQLFESKFRIVFETTKLSADKKKQKETFDINIIEDDGICEISNKSGGQRVWIETAIQQAISYVIRQQGNKIDTAFLDEKDGALDDSAAANYVDMLKKSHEMNGVYNTFFITHRTELLDFIPQHVRLVDGYVEVSC